MCLDLEDLANHRGSAFGEKPGGQVRQATWENKLAVAWMKVNAKNPDGCLALEDESRLIGHLAIPDVVFDKLRSSEVVYIEENPQNRALHILKEYVLDQDPAQRSLAFESFKKSTQRIEKKLGNARCQEILKDITECQALAQNEQRLEQNLVWIAKLLTWYYDPLYLESWERRKPKVAFRGPRQEALAYIREKCQG